MESHAVEMSLALESVIRSGALAVVTDDVERLLGEPGTSFHDHMIATVGRRMERRAS